MDSCSRVLERVSIHDDGFISGVNKNKIIYYCDNYVKCNLPDKWKTFGTSFKPGYITSTSFKSSHKDYPFTTNGICAVRADKKIVCKKNMKSDKGWTLYPGNNWIDVSVGRDGTRLYGIRSEDKNLYWISTDGTTMKWKIVKNTLNWGALKKVSSDEHRGLPCVLNTLGKIYCPLNSGWITLHGVYDDVSVTGTIQLGGSTVSDSKSALWAVKGTNYYYCPTIAYCENETFDPLDQKAGWQTFPSLTGKALSRIASSANGRMICTLDSSDWAINCRLL